MRSRGLFWELIQEEARAGVTVFVTTHFLEEVDYCDWVCFIDAGRLVADAAPEDLRRQHSDGYAVTIAAAATTREAVVTELRAAGYAPGVAGDDLQLHVPALDAPLLATLARLTRAGAAVHVAQPQMTDVFRRLLAEVPHGKAA